MNCLNSILIEGTLVKDPVFDHTPKGTAVCNFSIATTRYFKEGDGIEKEVSLFDIQAWDRLAESILAHGKEGRGVRVVGRLKQDTRYEDGMTRSTVLIIAEHVEFRPTAKQLDEVQF